ncbi:MAG: TonB-dependent receptor domain-containing protein [Parcubacteria group bacterium]
MGNKSFQRRLLGGAAAVVLMAAWGSAHAEDVTFNIAPQPLASALNQFGAQSDTAVLVRPDLAGSKTTKGVTGPASAEVALNTLLQGTGLTWRRDGDTFLIEAADPQSGSAAGDGADAGTVAALIVTAQKKEENIQDVPIAISAFTEKSLQEQKIEGGFDLLKAIPNVTFSKNNFTSYNFSIRGIGTKAVSATTDPGVAVSFNNIALLQNRLFEQEYFDVERVEVLRGPQGTLYGRNATAGVVNVISAKPDMDEFKGWLKGEVGNYHAKRLSAMVNVPLVEDKLAIRFAGALTDRQGYDNNTGTQHPVNGRDLWSGRVTVAFNPVESFRANLIWERFNEDDNRSRTGKQLCHRDDGLDFVGSTPTYAEPPLVTGGDPLLNQSMLRKTLFSQGCKMGSLYGDAAFGTPNGLAMPFVWSLVTLGQGDYPLNYPGQPRTLIEFRDPYGGMMQSRDLRVINSFRDPIYRAKADVVELNFEWNVTDNLLLSSQTAYNKDTTYSFQDYNRFNTVPIFSDTSDFIIDMAWPASKTAYRSIAPGGVFCDPQLGCSKSIAGFDIASAKGEQFTQEIRLQSSGEGPLNFSVGANYTRFHTLVDYYVMYNLMTAFAMIAPFNFPEYIPGKSANIYECYISGIDPFGVGVWGAGDPESGCPYIDPNPVERINGEGHNYFRSKNPYKLNSGAIFGELYWDVRPDLKVTVGVRYTDDKKTFIPVPSQVLLGKSVFAGGDVNRGYPELPAIKQHWGEFTGRLGVDWKPDLAWTDQTLLYAFYSHGYKGGGANPPSPGFGSKSFADWFGPYYPPGFFEQGSNRKYLAPMLALTGVDYAPTFKPEFVDALEAGSKNTLLGGALNLNLTGFLYSYRDYQVSQIKNRTAVNENFDAKSWGVELETMFAPSRNLQIIANLGFLDTRVADGETSIDIMNRTQGNPYYVVIKPWVQLPSNCVVPVHVAEEWLASRWHVGGWHTMCGGSAGIQDAFGPPPPMDTETGQPYTPSTYPEINGGAGIRADLGGNELPNAPHWTVSLGAQYGHEILDGSWRATVRADAYWQSQSWARVYNSDPYDKLHGWYNVNLSVWLERPEDDLKIEFYAKNLLDKTPITDAFLNSDDTGLTTNVFTLDPRLIGLSIRKGF